MYQVLISLKTQWISTWTEPMTQSQPSIQGRLPGASECLVGTRDNYVMSNGPTRTSSKLQIQGTRNKDRSVAARGQLLLLILLLILRTTVV